MVGFTCSGCGRSFKRASGLATHKRSCKKAPDQKTKEAAGETLHRLDELEVNVESLSARVTELGDKVRRMDELVELVVGYVCPTGRNLVGVTSQRVIELSRQVAALEESIPALRTELADDQAKWNRELKGWLVNVLPPVRV